MYLRNLCILSSKNRRDAYPFNGIHISSSILSSDVFNMIILYNSIVFMVEMEVNKVHAHGFRG